MLQENGVAIGYNLAAQIAVRAHAGRSCLYLALDRSIAMLFFIDNTANLRPEARFVIHYLQNNLKKDVYMLSGDAPETV